MDPNTGSYADPLCKPPSIGVCKRPDATRQEAPGQGMKRQMMQNAPHLLMMAFHRNVSSFALTLNLAAEQGPTVPPQVARVATAEMRRSLEEMEKYRAQGMRDLQMDKDRRKMMDEHIVRVKTNLRQLEELARRDRIDSEEVKKHLTAIFEGCEEAGCDVMPGGMGQGWHGRGDGGADGAMCDCPCGEHIPEHSRMMEKMRRKVKSQDAELDTLVQEMNRASGDRKLDLLAEVVTRMVRQRAELTADMEQMQKQMVPQPGAMTAPGGVMYEMDDEEQEFDNDEDMED